MKEKVVEGKESAVEKVSLLKEATVEKVKSLKENVDAAITFEIEYADPSIRENDVERFDAILHDPDSNHDDDLTGGDLAWSSFL